MSWAQMRLSGGPLLVVGLRDAGGALTSHRVNIDRNLHADLRTIADEALATVRAGTPVPYTPYVDQQEGEYLTLSPATLVSTNVAVPGQAGTQSQQTAALVAAVKNADVLPQIGAGALIDRASTDLYFQAICLRSQNDRVGFVTKTSARQILKRSAIPLGKDDPNDRLKRISRPELIIEPKVHAVIGPTEVAILDRNQFQFLVSDIQIISRYVAAEVTRIDSLCAAQGIVLSPPTRVALESKATASVQLAKRLDAFATRIPHIDISRVTGGGLGFSAQGLLPADFLNAAGQLECSPGRIVELLDALEGRYFDDAFSAEHRRADRFRPR